MTSKITNDEAVPEKLSTAKVGSDGAAGAHAHLPSVAPRKSYLDLFDPEPEPAPIVVEAKGEVVSKDDEEETDPFDREVKAMDAEIFRRSSRVVSASLRFAEVDFDEEGRPVPPSPEWMAEYGGDTKAALVAHRVATMANAGRNKMPAGMDLAARVFVGFIKARAEKPDAPKLNLTLVKITMEERKYPEKQMGEKT